MKVLTNDVPSGTIYEVMKWGEEVLKAHQRPDAHIDAKLLIMYVLEMNETKLLIERTRKMDESLIKVYAAHISERAKGVPLQYITNEQEFMGLSFYVDDRVLVPRQDTETLIETILQEAEKTSIKFGVDIGTGSGCISIALAHYIKDLKMTALDLSKGALEVATKNIKAHQLEDRITVIESDVLSQYPQDQKVDLVVSNPPYISIEDTMTLMEEVQNHEPHMALTDGGDGLSFYKKISKDAKTILREGGIIAYEIGYNQSKAVTTILEEEGYEAIRTIQDLAGKDRVVIARI